MKKFFECIGMISLVCVSFFVTEKTAGVVKESDQIMIEIKKASETHLKNSIDAIVKEDTIIPGMYGKKVEEEKSYEKMKRIGTYQENLLVYESFAPKISLEKQYDKYIISGNPKKNMVSLLFLVTENTDTSKIEKIIDQKKIGVSFFIDRSWLEKNSDQLKIWFQKDYTIGNLSNQMDYQDSSFSWIDTIIKKEGKQKNGFCYNIKPDQKALQMCSMNQNFTVRPTYVVKKNPLLEIKEVLAPGSIIVLPINSTLEKELPVVIEYIKGKGYKIGNLLDHLSEIE